MTDPHREKAVADEPKETSIARELVETWSIGKRISRDDVRELQFLVAMAIAAYGRERYDAGREDAAKVIAQWCLCKQAGACAMCRAANDVRAGGSR